MAEHTTKQSVDALFKDANISFRAMQENERGSTNITKYGALDPEWIEYHNSEGCGCAIFYLPNTTGGETFSDKDVYQFNACFIDIDNGRLPSSFLLPPSCVCSRDDGKGHHVYWFIRSHTNAVQWKATQNHLIHYYQSDPTVKNPARLMRLPGTINRKPDERAGQKYNIVELSGVRYDLPVSYTHLTLPTILLV